MTYRFHLWPHLFLLLIPTYLPSQADIYEWEYIDPANPELGKRQSTTLVPDGAGVDAAPGTFFNLDLKKAYLHSANLAGSYFGLSSLINADLSNADLTDVFMESPILTNADLKNAKLTGAEIRSPAMMNADLSGADLSHAGFIFSYIESANFTNANLFDSGFINSSLLNVTLAGLNLANSYFYESTLNNVNLDHVNLNDAKFDYCTLSGVSLYRASAVKTGFSFSTLKGTIFSEANLTHADFMEADLSRADFSSATLRNVNFRWATLTNANFTGTDVRDATFDGNRNGFTANQLFSTASYQHGDLSGIVLRNMDLIGADFASKNLTNANFSDLKLTNANFSHARLSHVTSYYSDLSNANLSYANLTNASFDGSTLNNANLTSADIRGSRRLNPIGATLRNLIQGDGNISGLELLFNQFLIVHDYDGDPSRLPTPLAPIPITIQDHFMMDIGGTLELRFKADEWNSIISFEAGIPVERGGTLKLDFTPDVNIPNQIGRTLHIFDWTGVTPSGTFTVESPYEWDLSKLYTTGEVKLLAVPEPRGVILCIMAILATVVPRRVGIMSLFV